MKSVGMVVEYNPFHNGHLFHLEKTKEAANADVVVAVMSGPFLQRGEPALLPKWNRAKMALLAGVDLVFELPYPFATQKADTFANGAVTILAAAGCEAICFGSESGNIVEFEETYQFLAKSAKKYEENIKRYLEHGVSYPRALSLAFKELEPDENVVDLSKPNNILGFQYYKAVKEGNFPMEVLTIPRVKAHYHDQHFSSGMIASATSIRNAIFAENNELEKLRPYLPFSSYELMKDYYNEFQLFHQWENYWPYLRFRLLQITPEELKDVYEVEEGIENRIIRVAQNANSFSQFMKQLKTKRYTWTRLQRMCVHILTNTKKDEMKKEMESLSYLRLLGMSEKGRTYLNMRKGKFPLPLISRIAPYLSKLELDLRASRIYAFGAPKDKQQSLMNLEFAQPPIYIKECSRA